MSVPAAIVLAGIERAGLPAPVAEFRFHPVRRWRLDYAWPEGFVALGWAIIRCTPQTILADDTLSWLHMALLDVEVVEHTLGDDKSGPNAVRHGDAWRQITRKMPL